MMNSDEIITSWIEEYLKNGDVAFDVGANQGLHTKTMLKAVGSEGKVIAFEPVPENIEKLMDIKLLNEELIVKALAVGDEVGKKQFNVDMRQDLGAAASSFHQLSGLTEIQQIEVTMTTLDNFVNATNNVIPNFIKIDVEGYELNVFKGAKHLIENHRPILVFEFWETWFTKVIPIFEFLKPGYKFISGSRGEDAYQFYATNECDGVTDILCLPTSADALNHIVLQNIF